MIYASTVLFQLPKMTAPLDNIPKTDTNDKYKYKISVSRENYSKLLNIYLFHIFVLLKK